MARRFWLSVLFVCFGLLASAQPNQLETGIALSQKGNHDGAKKVFLEIISKTPSDLEAKLELSRELMYLGEWTECFRYCKELIAQKKDTSIQRKTYVTYGTALDASGDKKGAVRAYKKGIVEYPGYYLLPFNLGVTYYVMGKKEDATEQFMRSARLNPSHASSAFFLALVMEERKNRIASVLALMRFLILEQKGSRSIIALGGLLQKLEGNVSRSGENQVNITVEPGQLDKKGEDNFASVDLFLSLTVATQMGNDGEKRSGADRLIAEINTLCSSLETNRSGQKGFFWQNYAPFFIELMKSGHAETISYIFLSYASDPANDVIQWVSDNKEKIESFFVWESNYRWPK